MLFWLFAVCRGADRPQQNSPDPGGQQGYGEASADSSSAAFACARNCLTQSQE